MLKASDIQIVVLDSPIRVWEDPQSREIFEKIVSLKLEGYGSKFNSNILTLDTSDFYGTHLAICRKVDGKLEVISAYRSVELNRYREYGHDFGILSIVKKSGSLTHVRYLNNLIQEVDQKNQSMRYCSSYTVKPSLRKDPESSALLKDLLTMMVVNFYRDSKTDIGLMLGVIRFKMDQVQWGFGSEPVSENGVQLPNFYNSTLDNTENTLNIYRKPSESALKLAEKYEHIWENRIEIAPAPLTLPAQEKIKIAA